MNPTIEVITTFFNDSFLAPFFLKHYSYANKIKVLLDISSKDCRETGKIIQEYPNAEIRLFDFPNGYDVSKMDKLILNHCNLSNADWILAPDSDEFIFCDDMHKFLASQTAFDIVKVRFYQVFRNAKDSDLDPDKPVMGQRKYGDPDYVKGRNRHQTKPIVFMSHRRVHLMPGHHGVWNLHRHKVSNDILIGQHWQMADPVFCVARRLSRRERLRAATLPSGYAFHDLNVTEEYILSECNAHLNDGELPT